MLHSALIMMQILGSQDCLDLQDYISYTFLQQVRKLLSKFILECFNPLEIFQEQDG